MFFSKRYTGCLSVCLSVRFLMPLVTRFSKQGAVIDEATSVFSFILTKLTHCRHGQLSRGRQLSRIVIELLLEHTTRR
jgi:hypothetical protein